MNNRTSPDSLGQGPDLSPSIPWILTSIMFVGLLLLYSGLHARPASPPPCNLQVTGVVRDVTCAGLENGAIDVMVSGGLHPYTFKWSSGHTTEDLDQLAPGIYQVTVYDVQQCMGHAIFIVDEPEPLTAAVVCEYPVCGGQPDCCLFLSGGVSPYSVFVYYTPNGNIPPNLPHPVITGNDPPYVPGMAMRSDIIFIPHADSVLCAKDVPNGTYFVLIVDHNFCWVWKVVTIQATPALNVTAVVKNVRCAGLSDGAIDITVTGGTHPYAYSWSNGASTEDVSGLSAGAYTVKLTDANGCELSETFAVTQPAPIAIEGAVKDVSCFGDKDGKIDVTVTGGTPPYHYHWSTGASTEDIHNLSSGVYSITVYDSRQCYDKATFIVGEPAPLKAEVVCEYPGCGGLPSCCLHISGGTGPYNVYVYYQPNPKATVILPDPNFDVNGVPQVPGLKLTNKFGFSGPTMIPDSVLCRNGVPNGTYFVLIVDAHGCHTWTEVKIKSTPKLEVKGTVTGVSCHGGSDGSIDLTVYGGTPPYEYTWSNGEKTQDIHNLSSGVYQVTIYDDHQCNVVKVFKVLQPNVLETGLTFDPYGSFACAHPHGGTAPFAITWFRLAPHALVGTGSCVQGLEPGSYLVTVVDGQGCKTSEIFVIKPQPCAGGHALVDPDTIHSGQNSTFFLLDYNGSTIQWQFMTEFTGWVDIYGATSSTYVTPNIYAGSTQNVSVRARVTCTNGSVQYSSVDTLHVIGQGGSNKMSEDIFDGKTLEEYFGMEVFPTVTDGAVTVRFHFDASTEVNIRVSDMGGRQVINESYRDTRIGDTRRLDLRHLERGMYMVTMEHNGDVVTGRVIVQ